MRDANKKMLEDTLEILENGYYRKDGREVNLRLSRQEMEHVQVLLPEDAESICSQMDAKADSAKTDSARVDARSDSAKTDSDRADTGHGCADTDKTFTGRKCSYSCENIDSFALARKRCEERALQPEGGEAKEKEILVLNLANPVHPGGGVRKGARAQEEDLCRKSSLLFSLESREAARYYDYNRGRCTFLGSDAMMFTPKVEIIRDENGDLLDNTVIVAVLTCAAPMVRRGKEGLSESEYRNLVRRRIERMLKCAACFGYRNLILGAWGCGAFGNDARVISDLFYEALKEMEKSRETMFERVDFAVLDCAPHQQVPKAAKNGASSGYRIPSGNNMPFGNNMPGGYNFREFYRNFAADERTSAMLTADERTGTVLTAVKGDITKNHGVQAIVNAANTSLLGGGGVDGAIHRAAGPGLLKECRTLNGCETGKAKITKGYCLPCEYVIHTPGPCWGSGKFKEEELLASCYQSCLELAADNGIRSVAFPSISTGIYRFPLELAAEIAVRTVKKFVKEHPGELDAVKWVLFDERTLEVYNRELERQKGR